MMKKYKKIISIIIAACILVGTVFTALDFMGVINLDSSYSTEEKRENIQGENKISDMEGFPWHIVFITSAEVKKNCLLFMEQIMLRVTAQILRNIREQ